MVNDKRFDLIKSRLAHRRRGGNRVLGLPGAATVKDIEYREIEDWLRDLTRHGPKAWRIFDCEAKKQNLQADASAADLSWPSAWSMLLNKF